MKLFLSLALTLVMSTAAFAETAAQARARAASSYLQIESLLLNLDQAVQDTQSCVMSMDSMTTDAVYQYGWSGGYNTYSQQLAAISDFKDDAINTANEGSTMFNEADNDATLTDAEKQVLYSDAADKYADAIVDAQAGKNLAYSTASAACTEEAALLEAIEAFIEEQEDEGDELE